MLPYFKIPKITLAQERRKEQELRAIIKTLARNKMKSPNDSKRSERSFKRLVPFDVINVKREPPPHLLTFLSSSLLSVQDWFSDLAMHLDDDQKWKMAKNLNTDPYLDGFTVHNPDYNDYLKHFQPNTLAKIFSVGDIDITEYGLKKSTIAMLYKLQHLGYLKLVKDGDPNASIL